MSKSRILLSPLVSKSTLSLIFIFFLMLCGVGLGIEDKYQLIWWPLLLILFMGALVIMKVYRTDGQLPVFDAGVVQIAITIIYCAYPLLSFILSGYQWTPLSDNRMYSYNVSVESMGNFAWNHALYVLSLTLSYLFFRSNFGIFPDLMRVQTVGHYKKTIFLSLTLFLLVYFELFKFFQLGQFSFFLLQLQHNLHGVFFVFTIALFAIALIERRKWQWRLVLIVYLTYEFAVMVMGGSGRTWFFLHLIALIMLYHRLVKPISFKVAFVGVAVISTAFMIQGFLRVGLWESIGDYSVWSAANEFSIMFGTAYDISIRLEQIGQIPLQVLISDLVLLIPSQLLPFEKIDPSQWYLEVIGLRGTGVGMMFGVIAQGVVGGGWLELILRGFALGLFFASLHKWYIKNSRSIWVIVSYVFIAVKSYYTYRAGSGYLLYFIVYQLMPAYFLYYAAAHLMGQKIKQKNPESKFQQFF